MSQRSKAQAAEFYTYRPSYADQVSRDEYMDAFIANEHKSYI